MEAARERSFLAVVVAPRPAGGNQLQLLFDPSADSYAEPHDMSQSWPGCATASADSFSDVSGLVSRDLPGVFCDVSVDREAIDRSRESVVERPDT